MAAPPCLWPRVFPPPTLLGELLFGEEGSQQESTTSFHEFRTGDRYVKDKVKHRVAVLRGSTWGGTACPSRGDVDGLHFLQTFQ